jgi:hypothetical protein
MSTLADAVHADPLARRAATFLGSLPENQRDAATWPFAHREREQVRFAPFRLDGVRHGDLSQEASAAADAMLEAALSARGFQTVRDIRNLERDVAKGEGALLRLITGRFRDPGRYLVAIFGEPDDELPWSFRYEGHHLSLSVTSAGGGPPATTPLFLGAQPRVVPEGWPSAGIAALGEEERLARALYAALSDEQRARAALPYDSGRGHMLGEVSRVDLDAPVGVARGEMNGASRALLDALVERFVGVWDDRTAAARRAEIDAAGRDDLHFAFVASDDPPHAYYARVQGPATLIEIDNTTDGDHVHAVWHAIGSDFGDDLLARHLRLEHRTDLAERFLHAH